ncbi:MAG: glycosyltransferase family 2 protein [Actinomycetaceae bacterium]|nr:glycosyltransferase family 2 protein [Actinomycetaceae bacterium]
MKVAAVVVTYNRSELLKKALTALEEQDYPVTQIIVIDNASTDDTEEVLRTRKNKARIRVHRLRNNTGGAGGFYYGMDVAFDLDVDAFWLMDDDTVPRPEALGELVRRMEEVAEYRGGKMPSYASSLVKWTDGTFCNMNLPTLKWNGVKPLAHGKTWLDLDCASFVSCLVTREAVVECGLPKPEYFIWFDDAEYTYRLAKWRPGIFVPESVVDHLMPSNEPITWDMVTKDNMWKFGRGAHNQAAASISLKKPRILTDLTAGMYAFLKGSDVPYSLRAQLAWQVAKGVVSNIPVRFPTSMNRKPVRRLKHDRNDM